MATEATNSKQKGAMTTDRPKSNQEPQDRQGDDSMATTSPPQVEGDFVPFSTRVRAETHRDVKILAVQRGTRVQDVVETALREYLDRHL